jgi:hypothetical protein
VIAGLPEGMATGGLGYSLDPDLQCPGVSLYVCSGSLTCETNCHASRSPLGSPLHLELL